MASSTGRRWWWPFGPRREMDGLAAIRDLAAERDKHRRRPRRFRDGENASTVNTSFGDEPNRDSGASSGD